MYDQLSEMVLYCHRNPRLTSPSTLSLAAQTPNAPQPLSVVDCSLGGGPIHSAAVTVPANAFPPLLAIRADRTDRWLYCDRDRQLTSSATLSLAAQTPNAPAPLSKTGLDRTIVLPVQPDYFPLGGYQLTATCASSETPPSWPPH